MPVLSCGGGMWRIGSGKCMYDSKEKALRAYQGYLGSKKAEASFDKPFPYKWKSRLGFSWIGHFFTDAGTEYRVSFDMEHEDLLGEGYEDEIWAWQFYVGNHKYGITGTGEAQQVFATVLAMFKEFNHKIKPAIVAFEAKEVSRTKLYARMLARYSRSLGFDRTSKVNMGHEHAFLLINDHLLSIDRQNAVAASLINQGMLIQGNVVIAWKDKLPGGLADKLEKIHAEFKPFYGTEIDIKTGNIVPSKKPHVEWGVYKNPTSQELSKVPRDARAFLTSKGDVFVANTTSGTMGLHTRFAGRTIEIYPNDAKEIQQAVVNSHGKAGITLQRFENTNQFMIGESDAGFLQDKFKNKLRTLFGKAKKKNPHLIFTNRVI